MSADRPCTISRPFRSAVGLLLFILSLSILPANVPALIRHRQSPPIKRAPDVAALAIQTNGMLCSVNAYRLLFFVLLITPAHACPIFV